MTMLCTGEQDCDKLFPQSKTKIAEAHQKIIDFSSTVLSPLPVPGKTFGVEEKCTSDNICFGSNSLAEFGVGWLSPPGLVDRSAGSLEAECFENTLSLCEIALLLSPMPKATRKESPSSLERVLLLAVSVADTDADSAGTKPNRSLVLRVFFCDSAGRTVSISGGPKCGTITNQFPSLLHDMLRIGPSTFVPG
nr:unnamed protein product [Callosobruchus chinensis]